jgi:hypothetical protein
MNLAWKIQCLTTETLPKDIGTMWDTEILKSSLSVSVSQWFNMG